MPKFRKLHTKIVESVDLNDMPDDTCRLFWVLLPTQLCREGRALNNLSWLKSRVFPLRVDLTNNDIAGIMTWLIERKMIIEYEVEHRHYFFVPTFHKYQGDTTKEAESIYPPPPKKIIKSNSGVTPEPVKSKDKETPKPSKKDSGKEVLDRELDLFIESWGRLFPDKPQPRLTPLRPKFKKRIEDKFFKSNWQIALGIAAKSDYLKEEGWFTAQWFLKNEENWEKCLNKNYANKKDKRQQKVDRNKEVIKEYFEDENNG